MGRAHSRRVIAVGDLNGAHALLRGLLRDLGVTNRRDRLVARDTHVIQIGDLFNRGPDARGALLFLEDLAQQAPARGSQVTVLLGNHEVMTALGNESYCTIDEYLSFATPQQRERWPQRVRQARRRLHREHFPEGLVLPVGPRLEAWKVLNVPGRAAMRRALRPRGAIGRRIRRLPLAVIDGDCLFSHAAVTPRWAKLGIDGLNDAVAQAWRDAPAFFRALSHKSILRDPGGPLWNRELSMKNTKRARAQVEASLRHLGASRMVVGHTVTEAIPDCERGRIALAHGGKLVGIDVGLGRGPFRTVLVIERGRGLEWTPEGTRQLWKP